MAVSKKAEGKAGEVKGKVKKKVGEAAGNEQLMLMRACQLART